MVHVVSAFRSIFDTYNSSLSEIPSSNLLTTVLLNSLSSAATDASQIKRTIIASNKIEGSTEEFLEEIVNKTELLKQNVLLNQLQENQSAIDIIWDSYQQVTNYEISNMLISGINIERYNSIETKDNNLTDSEVKLKKHFYEKSLQFANLNYFSDEIVPLENSRGKIQGNLLIEDENLTYFNQQLCNDVPLANGAACIFLANDDYVTQQKVAKMATIEFFCKIEGAYEEIIVKISEKCRQLNISENWIIEMDYFDFETVSNVLDVEVISSSLSILNPSGGSIILGNSKGLSGFRAIVSLANHMKRKQSQRGLAIVFNQRKDAAYLCVLKQ